jgi:uncharacterized repeat protein (TIGR03803 family)
MKFRWLLTISSLGLLALLVMPVGAAAQGATTYQVLHTFAGTGAKGEFPLGSVIRDKAGNLYGTASNGGDLSCPYGCGVVFKVDGSGRETVLYSFTGGVDGAYPYMGVLRDEAGNLYSTTHGGGDVNGDASCTAAFGFPGCGVVFKLDPAGKETALYAFTGGADGSGPSSGLIRDEAGNLYGTTGFGGFNGDCPGAPLPGCGVVFKLDPAGKETVLHTFTGGADGYIPYGNLLLDEEGNLYGAAVAGADVSGICSDVGGLRGCGTVFKLDRTGTFTVLHTFDGANGATPNGFLVPDNAGNLYGMTFYGGDLSGCSGLGCGVLFKLDRSGKETVLYSFTGGADGAAPYASVIRDEEGNLYGTTYYGGDLSSSLCSGVGCGVVFKLDPAGKETVLHTFTGVLDGANPDADLFLDGEGNLFSTASYGGDLSCNSPYGCGVVFKINAHHCAEGDETTERPSVVPPENTREPLQQRLRFGRFGTRLVEPQ